MSAESSRLLPTGEGYITNMNDDEAGDERGGWQDCTSVVTISSFIIAGVIAFTLLLLLHPNTESNDEYGVIVDAGSSHTGLYVYKWPGNVRSQGTAVPVNEVYSGKEIPGISFYVNNASGAGASLKGLLKGALKAVGPSKMSSTPVYLGATAGMRLVHEVNRTVSDQIMASVRKTLSESGFQFANANAKIISGAEEGSFGWITVNYLENVLQTLQKRLPSLGALDLGGASTQITFVPRNVSRATADFRLYGREYPVYTKTYLCYGGNEIYRRFLSELAKNSNYTPNVPNPCANAGWNETKDGDYLWRAPCSCKPNCCPLAILPSSFTFHGTSNSSECHRQVSRLFSFNTTCPKAKSFSKSEQPPIRGDFLAFSGYYYIVKDLNLPSRPTMAKFRSAYETFCNKSWNKVRKYHNYFGNASQICFTGHYIYALLTQGYGFNNQTWNITFKNSIDKKTIGWTLGYMINATNLIPRNEPKDKRLDDEILIPALVVCVLFILVGFTLCWRFNRQKKRINIMGYNRI